MQPGQSIRDFVTNFLSYARRKTYAFQLDSHFNQRLCVNALYNALPDNLRVALIRFRKEGTVEELGQAAIDLDEEIRGTRTGKGKNNSSSSSGTDSEEEGKPRKAKNTSRHDRNSVCTAQTSKKGPQARQSAKEAIRRPHCGDGKR